MACFLHDKIYSDDVKAMIISQTKYCECVITKTANTCIAMHHGSILSKEEKVGKVLASCFRMCFLSYQIEILRNNMID